MDSCILCLEINKDIFNCIKSDSVQWAELNVEKIIEKHFWSLNNIQLSSCICLSCWREVEEFHKFYLRIEEAHLNFAKIKVERLAETLEFNEELIINKETNDFLESIRDQLEFGVIEPESLIDQTQLKDLNPEILLDHSTAPGMVVDRDSTISEISDEVPLKQLRDKNLLKKSNKKKKKKSSKEMLNPEEKSIENCCTEESYVKEKPSDLKDRNDVDNDNDKTDAALREEKGCAGTSKNKKRSRKESDKFIAEHFKQMFCDVCQEPFEDFSATLTHFDENHKQRGYVVCCKKKFFLRCTLIDHLHSHLNPDYFKCNECGKAMSDRKGVDRHMLLVHRANEVIRQHCCDLCGKSFKEACHLKTHKLTHLPEDERKFPCADCGKNYGSPNLLHVHRKQAHLKYYDKFCSICGKAMSSNAKLKRHMNEHEGIPLPIVNCDDVCGLRLTSEHGLKLHKEGQHPVGLEFKEELIINKATNDFLESIKDQLEFCVIEPESRLDQTQLKDLTKSEILLDDSTAPDMDVDGDSSISKTSGELDDIPLKQLQGKDLLKKSNKKKKKRNSKEMLNPEEKSIENCTEESYVIEEPSDLKDTNDMDNDNDKSNADLREEKDCAETSKNKKPKYWSASREKDDKFINEHFKQMFCDVCQVPLEDFSAISKHFTENHKKTGYVICCKRKFYYRKCLVEHLHCHLNPDFFKCNECGKAMPDRKNYDRHMLRLHGANEVIKQHCCDLCGKSFINPYVLRTHKLIHLPEGEKNLWQKLW